MNWGDELCGVVVTPQMCFESGGWIVQHGNGRWVMHQKLKKGDHFYLEYGEEITWESACMESRSVSYGSYGKLSETRPIFPPRGWAGRTDAELWYALGDLNPDEERMVVCGIGEIVTIDELAQIRIDGPASYDGAPIDDPAALILALQNAQVLATRLGGGK